MIDNLIILTTLVLLVALTGYVFTVLKEKTPSCICPEEFVNVYSTAATGRLELSSSVGTNGLQPVTSTWIGILSSINLIFPKGNLALNFADANLGKPKVDPPRPFPLSCFPRIFHFLIRTLAMR